MTEVQEKQGRRFYVIFDGPPGPESGRFVEVEDQDGASVGVGEWLELANGMWSLGPFTEWRDTRDD